MIKQNMKSKVQNTIVAIWQKVAASVKSNQKAASWDFWVQILVVHLIEYKKLRFIIKHKHTQDNKHHNRSQDALHTNNIRKCGSRYPSINMNFRDEEVHLELGKSGGMRVKY